MHAGQKTRAPQHHLLIGLAVGSVSRNFPEVGYCIHSVNSQSVAQKCELNFARANWYLYRDNDHEVSLRFAAARPLVQRNFPREKNSDATPSSLRRRTSEFV